MRDSLNEDIRRAADVPNTPNGSGTPKAAGAQPGDASNITGHSEGSPVDGTADHPQASQPEGNDRIAEMPRPEAVESPSPRGPRKPWPKSCASPNSEARPARDPRPRRGRKQRSLALEAVGGDYVACFEQDRLVLRWLGDDRAVRSLPLVIADFPPSVQAFLHLLRKSRRWPSWGDAMNFGLSGSCSEVEWPLVVDYRTLAPLVNAGAAHYGGDRATETGQGESPMSKRLRDNIRQAVARFNTAWLEKTRNPARWLIALGGGEAGWRLDRQLFEE